MIEPEQHRYFAYAEGLGQSARPRSGSRQF